MPRAKDICKPGDGTVKSADRSPYARGDFFLGTKDNSPNYYVYRYDPEKRSVIPRTTGTSDLILARRKLDEMYLEATDQAEKFCPHCGQKMPDGNAYTLIRAINDYKIEHGSKKTSYEAIRSRINHVIRFVLERYDEDTPCSTATTDKFVNEFRQWLLDQPVVWRNASGEITSQKARTASSVEESVHQLRAVLNFAVKQGRSDAVPMFSTKTRAVVSKPVRERASLEDLAEMVKWASVPNERREGLLRFLVASICTAARPDAVFDMSVHPDRFQWWERENRFDLNPHGRVQTKKFRPVVPVLPPLRGLIDTASEDGWIVHYYGRRVADVRTSWRNMIADLGLGGGRGWGAYVLRRSMAQLLREGQASAWDVQGLLGHREAGTSEIYTSESLFPTAMARLQDIIADIEDKSGHSLSTFAVHLRSTNEKEPV